MGNSRRLKLNRWDTDNDCPYPFLTSQQYHRLLCNGARAIGFNGLGQLSDGQMFSLKQTACLLVIRSIAFEGEEIVDLDREVEETFPLFMISPVNLRAVTFCRTRMTGGYEGYRENYINLDLLKARQEANPDCIRIVPQPPKSRAIHPRGFDPDKTLLDYIRGRGNSRHSAALSSGSPTIHTQDIGSANVEWIDGAVEF